MPKKGQTWTPEQRAKIEAAKAARRGDPPAPEPLPPRQRIPLQAIPEKPKGSRWTMKAGNNWEEMNENVEGVDELKIAKDQLPEGMTLQWVTESVYGQLMPQHTQRFTNSGWTEVHQEDFDGAYEGWFMAKNEQGPIRKDGLILMAKPTPLVEKSKQRDLRAAREQVAIKEQALHGGDMPGVMGADHPSARRFNHISREMGRVVTPSED